MFWLLFLSISLTGKEWVPQRGKKHSSVSTHLAQISEELLFSWHIMINSKNTFCFIKSGAFFFFFFLTRSVLLIYFVWDFFFSMGREKEGRRKFILSLKHLRNEKRAKPTHSKPNLKRCKTLPDGCRKLLQRLHIAVFLAFPRTVPVGQKSG